MGKVLRPLKYSDGRFLRSTSQARAMIPLLFCTLKRAINPHQPLPSCFYSGAAPCIAYWLIFWCWSIRVLPKTCSANVSHPIQQILAANICRKDLWLLFDHLIRTPSTASNQNRRTLCVMQHGVPMHLPCNLVGIHIFLVEN